MAASGAEARFSIPVAVDGTDDAKALANALEDLRTRIASSTEKIRELSSANGRLKGTSLEVKKAKEELTAKLRAERDAVSAAQLKLTKLGGSYGELQAKAKAAADKQKELTERLKKTHLEEAKQKTSSLGAAMRLAGGPALELKERLAALSEIAGPSGASTALNVATLATVGLVAAVAALAAGVAVGAVALAKFIVSSGNAARSAQLQREAWAGSAQNATNLGTQIDALAKKVPTSKAALNDLSVSLMKNGLQGQTLVDTFNAVGQAASALGDDAANKLRDFVERGRLSQRVQINPLEMQGTGVQFDDIAKALAKNMKVGIGQARQALFEGRVKLGDGAKAMRDAIEAKFGGLNLRKMLSLEVIVEKAHEALQSLTKGVNIEPLVKSLGDFFSLFDESEFTGTAIRELVSLFGNGLVGQVEKGTPLAKTFFKTLVLGALTFTVNMLRLRKELKETFGSNEALKGIDLLKSGFKVLSFWAKTGELLLYGMAAGLGLLGAIAIGAGVALDTYVLTPIGNVSKFIEGIDWPATGRAIIDGIIDGLKGTGAGKLIESVKDLADSVSKTFTGKLKIRSPSRVFAGYGRNISEGAAEGIEDGTPEVARALDEMAPMPPRVAGASSGARSAGPPEVHVHIDARGATKEAVDVLTDEGFLEKLQKHLADALASMSAPPVEVG